MRQRLSGKWFRVLLALACCSGPAIGSAASSSLLFEGNFEQDGLANYVVIGGSPAVSADRARGGSRALKSVIDYGAMTGTFDSVRTETKPNDPPDGPYIKSGRPIIGQDYWYGFSIFLPADFVPSSDWEIVTQWHVDPDSAEERKRNPPMTITTTDGRWRMRSSWDDSPITQKDANGNWVYGGTNRYDLGPYQTGVWTDWVVHVKWSYKDDGVLEVWKDGVKVISQLKTPNCYNDIKGPYIKFGIYKGWTSGSSPEPGITKRVLYHDEFRMAGPNGSYDVVAPGEAITKPAPPHSMLVE